MSTALEAPLQIADGVSAFLSVRPRLFGIAYRMLGSAAEAEDILQDVWIRWHTANRSLVRDAAAFLVTTATRLAINVMQSERARRETNAGPWLSEPVDPNADPRLGAERHQALACGVLLLLERLTPTERAAYILREAFDYPYRDIANVLGLAEANARQVVTRARQRIVSGRTTANVFRVLQEAGVPTHFVAAPADEQMVVRRCTMIPLEVVMRRVATGSYLKRNDVAEGTRFAFESATAEAARTAWSAARPRTPPAMPRPPLTCVHPKLRNGSDRSATRWSPASAL